MAYELTALIGVGLMPSGAVSLSQGAWLLPLLDEAHEAAALSRGQDIVFLTAEFFGGVGAQTATLFRDGREERRFSSGYFAINEALAALGIMAELPKDAFDTLGLGRYRHTEDWIRASGSPPSL